MADDRLRRLFFIIIVVMWLLAGDVAANSWDQ